MKGGGYEESTTEDKDKRRMKKEDGDKFKEEHEYSTSGGAMRMSTSPQVVEPLL